LFGDRRIPAHGIALAGIGEPRLPAPAPPVEFNEKFFRICIFALTRTERMPPPDGTPAVAQRKN
jgi:hypothetical protein